MLTHLIVFIYIFATSYVTGRFIGRKLSDAVSCPPVPVHPILYSVAGLCFIMVLAGFFSLFAPIGLLFNLVLVVLSLLLAVVQRKEIFRVASNSHWKGVGGKAAVIFLVFTLVVVLVKSSGPITNPDTGGYHLPFVKWTEQYPAIKGLANLHSRLGFNYQYLVLSAVYGFSFLGVPTLHATNGYILFLLIAYIVSSSRFIKSGKLVWTDASRMVVLFFVINMSNAASSLSPDFPSSAMAILAILLMLDKAEDGSFWVLETKAVFVFLASLTAVLFKLSVAPVLLFNLVFVLPALRDFRKVALLFIVALVAVIPYLARNYLLTGYLVYPLYSVDIFNVPWKLPLAATILEKEVVRYYALNLPVGAKVDLATMLRSWFGYLRTTNPVYVYIVYAVVVAFGLNMALLVYAMVKRTLRMHLPLIVMNGILVFSLIYWFRLGPDPRFGNGYIIPFIAIVAGLMAYRVVNRFPALFILGTFAVCMLLQAAMLKGTAVSQSYFNKENRTAFHLLKQAPYPVPDTFSVLLQNGQKLYRTIDNTGCWDAPLPCTFTRDVFAPGGKELRDGFWPAADSTKLQN